MNARIPFLLIVLAVMVWVLPGGATSDTKDPEDTEAAAAEFEQFISLERAVHFLTPEGADVVVSPGAYTVEAGDAALRLIPEDVQHTQPFMVRAEATTHQESLEVVSPISTRIDEDKHAVALLLPEGKVLQAVGSYSGVRARGSKKKKGGFRYKGRRIILKPRIEFITTTPIKEKKKVLRVGEQVFIKGANFGAFREGNGVGKVLIHGRFKHNVPSAVLQVEKWESIRIKARIQSDFLETLVRDQSVKIQVKTAKGISSTAWKMPFRAARESKWLNYTDKVVKVRRCSGEANLSYCNGIVRSDLPVVFAGPCQLSNKPPIWKGKRATIWGRHKNCNMDEDWDEGSDQYEIRLKNGWVFKDIKLKRYMSSSKEWVMMPGYGTLKKEVHGTSSWKPKIKWMISPSDYVEYTYWVQIEGPNGIPH